MIDHAISYVDYCEQVLAPVWERWAMPRVALRAALARGDRREQRACRARLLTAVESILQLHDSPGMRAAACAGLAALSALQGDPDRRFWEAAEQALELDREATARHAQA